MGKILAAKKRDKRKDFQKVKFKVGIKLAKNQNETRANFKAKTLIIKQCKIECKLFFPRFTSQFIF